MRRLNSLVANILIFVSRSLWSVSQIVVILMIALHADAEGRSAAEDKTFALRISSLAKVGDSRWAGDPVVEAVRNWLPLTLGHDGNTSDLARLDFQGLIIMGKMSVTGHTLVLDVTGIQVNHAQYLKRVETLNTDFAKILYAFTTVVKDEISRNSSIQNIEFRAREVFNPSLWKLFEGMGFQLTNQSPTDWFSDPYKEYSFRVKAAKLLQVLSSAEPIRSCRSVFAP